ncbi:hypothetical protein XENOCAPTIV_030326 [Xenoophorus captivus]|uniref:Aldehyde oxidase/xanthine dehydrogenase a/b hammerhead domain-containing protein n=1 Tax=Xenoophorus captivus TaxID=1517983 RepID=A0ABV0QYM7_9TELE
MPQARPCTVTTFLRRMGSSSWCFLIVFSRFLIRLFLSNRGLDMSEALKLPGVVDVITANDIPGKKARPMFGYEQELFAEDEVLCVGQTVCAVLADTKTHAKRGAAAVKITYEDLPDPIFTIESMLVVPVGEEKEFKVYISTQWPTLIQILLHLDNAYNIPNLRGHSAACRTNIPSNTAFRGFGVPQGLLVVREINMYKGPSVTHYKVEFSPDNLQRCWEQCKLRSDYGARRKALDQFNQQNRWKKRGISIIPIKYGIAFAESFLNQVASRELHVPTSKIFISETSTATVPNTCPSAASFGTDANGMAVKTLKTDMVMDIGRSINPSVDIGQIEGAFTQGLGLYTLEELHYSPTGMLYSRGPSQYKIPAVCDMPLQFSVYLLPDSYNPHAIYSSKVRTSTKL